MSSRNGRYVAALGGLAALFLSGAAPVEPASKPQGRPQPAPSQPKADPGRSESMSDYERESLAVDRAANRIAETANAISDAQRSYAFWQLVLSFAGVGFTGIAAFFAWRATHWAKEAASHTKRSADADNAALTETRNAAAEARKDAEAQAERFRQELKIAKDNLDAAREATFAIDRAWLSVHVELSGPLVFEGDEVRVDVSCVGRNIGRSPATKVLWDWGLFGTPGAAHQKIADHTRYRHVGVTSYGHVLLPSDDFKEDFTLTMKRAEFIEACEQMAAIEPVSEPGTFPCIIVGLQYALPGEQKRRFTYMSYYIARTRDGSIDFDGSEGQFELAELELRGDRMAGPVT